MRGCVPGSGLGRASLKRGGHGGSRVRLWCAPPTLLDEKHDDQAKHGCAVVCFQSSGTADLSSTIVQTPGKMLGRSGKKECLTVETSVRPTNQPRCGAGCKARATLVRICESAAHTILSAIQLQTPASAASVGRIHPAGQLWLELYFVIKCLTAKIRVQVSQKKFNAARVVTSGRRRVMGADDHVRQVP